MRYHKRDCWAQSRDSNSQMLGNVQLCKTVFGHRLVRKWAWTSAVCDANDRMYLHFSVSPTCSIVRSACTNKQCATIENYRPKANTLAYCLYRFSLIIRIVISGSHRARDTFAGSHMCGICVVRIDCINQDHCHASLSGIFFCFFSRDRARA